jgi:hypothetical protein
MVSTGMTAASPSELIFFMIKAMDPSLNRGFVGIVKDVRSWEAAWARRA